MPTIQVGAKFCFAASFLARLLCGLVCLLRGCPSWSRVGSVAVVPTSLAVLLEASCTIPSYSNPIQSNRIRYYRQFQSMQKSTIPNSYYIYIVS